MDKDKQIKNYKTLCCKSTYTRLGRANYECDKCKKDISMELILFIDCVMN